MSAAFWDRDPENWGEWERFDERQEDCSSLPRPIPAPVCNLCQQPWGAGHDCTAREAHSGRTSTEWMQDRMSACPCRPENGGSGVCGCILSGPQVTC